MNAKAAKTAKKSVFTKRFFAVFALLDVVSVDAFRRTVNFGCGIARRSALTDRTLSAVLCIYSAATASRNFSRELSKTSVSRASSIVSHRLRVVRATAVGRRAKHEVLHADNLPADSNSSGAPTRGPSVPVTPASSHVSRIAVSSVPSRRRRCVPSGKPRWSDLSSIARAGRQVRPPSLRKAIAPA